MSELEVPARVAQAMSEGIKARGATKAIERQALVDSAKGTAEWREAGRHYASRVAARERLLGGIFSRVVSAPPLQSAYLSKVMPNELAERLAEVSLDEIEPPAVSVAGPLLEGLARSVEEPSLREMYLNLLATAASGRTKHVSHPSFVQVMQQLDSDEAVELEALTRRIGREEIVGSSPTASVVGVSVFAVFRDCGQHAHLLQEHLLRMVDERGESREEPRAGDWVNNWIRLGLCTVDYDESNDQEDWAETRPEFLRWSAWCRTHHKKAPRVRYGVLALTQFGKAFLRAAHGLDFPSAEARAEIRDNLGPVYAGRGGKPTPPVDEEIEILNQLAVITTEVSRSLPGPVFETVSVSLSEQRAHIGFFAPLSEVFASKVERGIAASGLPISSIRYHEYGSPAGSASILHPVPPRREDTDRSGGSVSERLD